MKIDAKIQRNEKKNLTGFLDCCLVGLTQIMHLYCTLHTLRIILIYRLQKFGLTFIIKLVHLVWSAGSKSYLNNSQLQFWKQKTFRELKFSSSFNIENDYL